MYFKLRDFHRFSAVESVELVAKVGSDLQGVSPSLHHLPIITSLKIRTLRNRNNNMKITFGTPLHAIRQGIAIIGT